MKDYKMKIGLIGFGVVGKAIDYTLSKEYDLIIYDKYLSVGKFEDLLGSGHTPLMFEFIGGMPILKLIFFGFIFVLNKIN